MPYETPPVKLKECQDQVLDVLTKIINHGYGEMRIIISEVKGKAKTKVVICAGRTWVVFIEKRIPGLDKPDIL